MPRAEDCQGWGLTAEGLGEVDLGRAHDALESVNKRLNMPHNQFLRFRTWPWPMAALCWPRAGRRGGRAVAAGPMAGFWSAFPATCQATEGRVLAARGLPCARRGRGKWMLAEALRPWPIRRSRRTGNLPPSGSHRFSADRVASPAGLRPFHQGHCIVADVPATGEPETSMNRELAKSCALALFRRSSLCCWCRPAAAVPTPVAQSAAAGPCRRRLGGSSDGAQLHDQRGHHHLPRSQVMHRGGTLSDTHAGAPSTRGPGWGVWSRQRGRHLRREVPLLTASTPDGQPGGTTWSARTRTLSADGKGYTAVTRGEFATPPQCAADPLAMTDVGTRFE